LPKKKHSPVGDRNFHRIKLRPSRPGERGELGVKAKEKSNRLGLGPNCEYLAGQDQTCRS